MRFPLVIIAFALFAVQLFAQPKDLGYEPPAGWTYVMNLDSVDVLDVHSFNDTIVLHGYTLREPIPPEGREFKLYSLNGGITWDTLIQEKYNDNVGYLGGGFFPNSNRIYRLVHEQDTATLVRLVSMRISYDLGKTFPERYDYDTLLSKAMIGTNRSMQFHPLAPDEGFYVRGQSIFYTVFRTLDGGKTWQYQPLPPPRDGRGVYYQILQDVRNPKTWNVWVNGSDHSWVDDFYQTRDDGKSFSYINQWGNYSGISSEGVIRKEWVVLVSTPNSALKYPVGFFDVSANGDTIPHNWAKTIYGSSAADGNLPKAHLGGVTLYNYKFYSTNPHHAFINGGDEFTDTASGKVLKRSFHIWETKNDGETWEMIWSPEPPVAKIFIDEKTNTLYVVSFYNGYNVNNPAHYELWKRQIATSIEAKNPQTPAEIADLKIFPYPAENSTQISFKSSTSGKVEIAIYDILGTKIRTIYSGQQEAGEQKLIWNIPAEIPSGTYFLKLESGGQSVTEKIVITR